MLTIASAGGESEQRRWALRCDALQKLHHPSIARLVGLRHDRRIAAIRGMACDGSLARAGGRCQETRTRVRRPGHVPRWRRRGFGRELVRSAVAVPKPYPPGRGSAICHSRSRAISVIESSRGRRDRRVVRARKRDPAARDRVMGTDRCGQTDWRSTTWRAWPGSMGFVPVAARVLPEWGEWTARTESVRHRRRGVRLGWRVLLGAALASPAAARPAVRRPGEVPSVEGIGLEPVPVDVLVGAVSRGDRYSRWSHLGGSPSRRAGGPAVSRSCCGGRNHQRRNGNRRNRRSRGGSAKSSRRSPASRRRHVPRGPLCTTACRVAEQSAVYVWRRRIVSRVTRIVRHIGRPPVEPAALAEPTGCRGAADCRRPARARRTRPAPGGRRLVAARRLGDAGEGSVALAGMLLRRGACADAQATLQSAADYWRRAGDEARLIDVAVLSGRRSPTSRAQTRPKPRSAPPGCGTLRTRCPATRARADVACARAVLAGSIRPRPSTRCLSVDESRSIGGASAIGGSVSRIGAATAIGTRQLDLAVSRATELLRHAQHAGEPRSVAEAAYARHSRIWPSVTSEPSSATSPRRSLRRARHMSRFWPHAAA